MAIYEPHLFLSPNDKETLILLGEIALSAYGERSNICSDSIALSPREAEQLLKLLEDFASSKRFLEGAYLAEGLANDQAWSDPRLKRIYSSQRAKHGQSQIMSGQHWRELVVRAGIGTAGNTDMGYANFRRGPVRPMSQAHFLKMEAKLAASAGLNPRVQRILIEFAELAMPGLEKLRDQKISLNYGSVRQLIGSFQADLTDHVNGTERTTLKRQRVAAVAMVVMDTAALFTTRDWTATGVLSTLAATVAAAIE
jgi:hypothetical protein